MLSARNFPGREGGVQKERLSHRDDSFPCGLVCDSLNVLMSSLSIKSHNLSITSCTCFMHFPCLNHGTVTKDNILKSHCNDSRDLEQDFPVLVCLTDKLPDNGKFLKIGLNQQ